MLRKSVTFTALIVSSISASADTITWIFDDNPDCISAVCFLDEPGYTSGEFKLDRNSQNNWWQ